MRVAAAGMSGTLARHLATFAPPAVAAFVAVAVLVFWTTSPPPELTLRVPGLDNAPPREEAAVGVSQDASAALMAGVAAASTVPASWPLIDQVESPARIAAAAGSVGIVIAPMPPQPGRPIAGLGRPSSIADAWPWFRGPNRDAISVSGPTLARSWPPGGPKRLWSVDMAEGYAAAAVSGGRVYVLDYWHDEAAAVLRRLTSAQQRALADALEPIPAEPDAVRAAVGAALAAQQNAGASSVGEEADSGGPSASGLSAAETEVLCSGLMDLLEQGRNRLLLALRLGQIDLVDRSGDLMRCLSLDDGREIWRNSYPVQIKPHHGITRTVPAVVENYVISFGPKCHVACWDSETGKAYWLIDLVRDHGAVVPEWYAGQCPLVDEKTGRLVLAVGGKALLMSVDYRTGEIIWRSPNPRGWTMTHSSIMPMELAGRRMYVYCGKGGVAGVSADDGSILWDTTEWQVSMATCPSPVVFDDGRVFLCGGYNSGCLMLAVEYLAAEGRFAARVLYRESPKLFGSEQQTPVLWNGYLYGVRQRDGQLVCLDPQGKPMWSSGRDKFGSAPYMIADGLILALSDDGVLTLAEATPQAYRPLARAQVIDGGVQSWGPMALVAGRLIVRDLRRMVCVDLRAHAEEQ